MERLHNNVLNIEQADRNGNIGDLSTLLGYLLDGPIGTGQHRTVYRMTNPGSRHVAKIAHQYETLEYLEGIRMNVAELNLWYDSQEMPEVRKWLCPVHHISNDGRMLVMSETIPLNDAEWTYVHENAPDWLRKDFKRENFGRLITKEMSSVEEIVCIDYGIINVNKLVATSCK